MRSDERVGVVEAIRSEKAGFLQRGFVAEFHGLEGKFAQLAVAAGLMGHHHVGEGELAEEFTKDPCGLALARSVAALDRDQVHAQSSRWSSKSSLANRFTIMPNKISVGPTMIKPRLNSAPAARYWLRR